MEHLLVKLCGLRTEADVAAANAALPDFAGFVIEVPGKRRSVALEAAIALAKRLDKRIRPVGVFVNAPVETVNRFLAETQTPQFSCMAKKTPRTSQAFAKQQALPSRNRQPSGRTQTTKHRRLPKRTTRARLRARACEMSLSSRRFASAAAPTH